MNQNILNRDFYSSKIDEKYVEDTYTPTSEGWVYLATLIDLYSRKIVGCSIDKRMRVSLLNDALKKHRIIQSMSRKENCHDNTVAESFFHILKTELAYHEVYFTKEQAKRLIFGYVEVFYI